MHSSVLHAVRPLKWLPVDAFVWLVAIPVAVWARYDFTMTLVQGVRAVVFAVLAIGLNTVFGVLVGVYLGRYLGGSFEEAIAIAVSGALTGSVLFGAAFWFTASVPRSTPLVATAVAIVGILASRFVGRAWTGSWRRSEPERRNAVIFGAGAAGTQLVRQLRADDTAKLRPVAFLDDDPARAMLQVSGVKVRGTRRDIAGVAARTDADTMVIAIPSADAEDIRDLTRRAEGSGLRVLVLPSLSQNLKRTMGPGDLRDIDVNDLLGRHPITLDEAAITRQVAGKRVLVTGAGGSIGSELCRQIHRFGPAELIMLDRDESALHAVQLSLYGKAMLDGDDTVLADIRDAEALDRVFSDRRPEVAFHAAALKHLPLLESHPLEAWKTNVVGTHHVLQCALRHGVETFVNISTDKAADPVSVLGHSKRIAERLTAGAATHATGKYVSVRFGNVLGSRGSVLTAFERQIAAGGPVTVTHPDVTRYFMTISEACQLVLQATVCGSSGEVLVLDMGAPISILEVARLLIDRADRSDLEVVFTGLRHGEKMHEDLFGSGEPRDHRPAHQLISHVPVQPAGLRDLTLDVGSDDEARWVMTMQCATSDAPASGSSRPPGAADVLDPDHAGGPRRR